jgi:hypothetical protein
MHGAKRPLLLSVVIPTEARSAQRRDLLLAFSET